MRRILVMTLTTCLAQACGGNQAPRSSQHPGHARGHGHDDGHGHGHNHASGHPGADAEHAHNHDFSDAESYAELFDHPDRDGWQKPAEVVRLLQITPGMTVADLGAGTGYFLPHLSPAVGAEGHVIGLDVEPNMVRYMEQRISREGLTRAEARHVPTDGPGLLDASVDRILIVDTWHHIADRAAYAAKLRRALRPGGFVLVVDFTRDSEHGPPPAMRLPPETVVAELAQGGLAASVVEETLPMQYVVIARLP